MTEHSGIPRSPELMSRHDTVLAVVDVQERLLPAIRGGARVAWNVRRLIEGAQALGMPVLSTEQYPKGLGPTVPELAGLLGAIPSKLTFSCGGCGEFAAALASLGRPKALVCGIEAHVCVAQTVFDLLGHGWRVYLAVDAVGSRFEVDYQTAVRRMDTGGAVVTTTEAALFEWCYTAESAEFKAISRLVREEGPAA